MRKITAVFLLVALFVTVFASCKKDKEDETTLPPQTGDVTTYATQPTPVASTTDSNTNATYILTTSPDQILTMGATTRFAATDAFTTTAPTGIVIQIPSQGNTSPVQPNYSQAPTTTPVTTSTTKPSTTTTKPTTTKPTTTKPVKKTAVSVDTGSSAFSGESTLIVDVDGSNWSSQFVSNTQYLPAYINGNNTGKNVKCTLSSKPDAAGNYSITIDVSELSLSSGADISISFPEGYIQTKAGTQYSNAFTVYSTY